VYRYTRKTLVREVIVILLALLMLSPFYLLVNIAFKPDQDLLGRPAAALPSAVTLENFGRAAEGTSNGNLWLGMLNSALITGGTLLLLVAFGSIAAFAIARRPGRTSRWLFVLYLVGLILPFQLGMIPAFVAMRNLHLLGTHAGMILLYSGLLMPLAVFLYAGFARGLPRDYEEAAQLDGAGRLQTFIRIVFPLLGPATGTVCILGGLPRRPHRVERLLHGARLPQRVEVGDAARRRLQLRRGAGLEMECDLRRADHLDDSHPRPLSRRPEEVHPGVRRRRQELSTPIPPSKGASSAHEQHRPQPFPG
jgi:raffinose/stachyose/melibiose transport system permease protein